jgi:hypothetical protein
VARHINPLCLECSRLDHSDAIALNGPGTKTGCWNARTCPRRRSHYRHRLENNAKQRGDYRALKTKGQAVEIIPRIFIPIKAPPVTMLYLFRENRHDAHLHAISATIWQGNRKLYEVEPVHCMGMTNRQVNEYLRNVLAVVGEKFEITEFEPPIRMEPMECPISDCPLKVCQ